MAPRLLRSLAGAAAAAPTSLAPDSLHAAALANLLWPDGEGIRLKRSISYLHGAARLDPNPARRLADLSAAYLTRAEWTQSPRDVLNGLEAAEQALEREPRSAAARFNRALALERLWLVEEAERAWTSYLEVDSTSGWADEARCRRRRVANHGIDVPAPRPASAARAAEWAAAAPQEAQLFGWDHVLGEWGDAVMNGDSTRAEDRLRLAAELGSALQRRGGDASLADAVRTARARANPGALARAHRDYGAAREAYRMNRRREAEAKFAAVLGNPGASRPLRQWAAVFHAATLVYREDYAGGERALRALVAEVDTLRHPALAGRTRWHLGTTLLRRGRYEGSSAFYRDAARLLRRASEREHAGAVMGYAGDAQFQMGNSDEAYASLVQGLAELHPYRESVWLHSLVWSFANAVTSDGLARAGVRIQNEGVGVAERIHDRPEYGAEAHLARARALAAAGKPRPAAHELDAARSVVHRLAPGAARDWLTQDVRLVEAELATDPARADTALESAIAFFGQNALRLLPALTRRADVRLSRNDTPGAMADLERVIRLLDQQRDSIRQAPLRAALLEKARSVFDRAVMLQLRAGRRAEALALLERGRAAYAPMTDPPSDTIREGGWPAARPDELIADYALVGDTLLTWTVSGAGIQLFRSHIERDRLTRTIERARLSLELRSPDGVVKPALDTLYRWLVGPIEAQLAHRGITLIVVADGEVASVPFPALYDARRGRYLVQDHPLRFAGSLHEAQQPATVGPSSGTVLLVADPAFARDHHPGLDRLRGAAQEVAALREIYPAPRVLTEGAVDGVALVAALRTASIAHYAGHAVFDDDRPDHSFLVLAPGPDGKGPGRLTASAIDTLDLGRLRLVVLSACETLRSRAGRTGGFAGLSAAFLHAGTHGVVGSLWRVDDELSRPLMLAFHREYRRFGDGAGALRLAQLELLGSRDPALQSPSAWAGFRFAGR